LGFCINNPCRSAGSIATGVDAIEEIIDVTGAGTQAFYLLVA